MQISQIEITEDRLEVLRQADDIMIQEIKTAGLYKEIAQAFAVLLPVSSIGVMGDERTYENVIALRAVETLDYMTADWVRLPHDLLARTPTALSTKSEASTALFTISAPNHQALLNGSDVEICKKNC